MTFAPQRLRRIANPARSSFPADGKLHLFRIALDAKSLQTGEKWTTERFASQHDISTTFLYELLRGKGTSGRVEPILNAFINEGLSYTRTLPLAA